MMRILANENISPLTVDALRRRGHDVVSVREDAPGSDDVAVLARAQAEGRIVVTFDKDFGDLAFRAGLPATSGVVLFRVRASSAQEEARLVVAALESRDDWAGRFAVVDDVRVRVRLLPSANGSQLA